MMMRRVFFFFFFFFLIVFLTWRDASFFTSCVAVWRCPTFCMMAFCCVFFFADDLKVVKRFGF
ncbi:hypothetical protein QBC45DRAFT_410009 [Copromyces sp. CBS 386.78]|nr:hypothetical protein QBC45DRAFT_410009 [Copromyces sp. CBS 386.78]